MPLDAATVLALAAVCAPDVAPTTLLAIARVESGLDPLAIAVNGATNPRPLAPRTAAEATQAAQALVARGANVDLGLAQINSRNLARLGLTVSKAFEPCANLRAAADVLTMGYRQAAALKDEQARLRVALSVYNTGHPQRGFRNGYVSKVAAAAGVRDPASAGPQAPAPFRPITAAWRVFDGAPTGGRPFVVSFQPGDRP